MTRKDAVIRKLKSVGGWPYGIRKINITCDCRVFFDGVYLRDFINKKDITEFMFNGDVVITRLNYESMEHLS